MVRAVFLVLLASLMLAISALAGSAQQPAAPPPDKIADLIKILDDPSVRDWLKNQGKTATQPANQNVLTGMRSWEAGSRARFKAVVNALPRLPSEIGAAATRVRLEAKEQGFAPAAVILIVVLVVSLIGEWIARRTVDRILRVHPLLMRTAVELLPLAVFTLIATVFFLLVDWPPRLGSTVLAYLVAAVVFRMVAALCAMGLAAGSLSPFIFRRILVFSGVLLLSLATTALADQVAMPEDAANAFAFVASVVLLAICLETVWRRPDGPQLRTKILWTLYFLGLWLLWCLGFNVAFWTVLYMAIFPVVMPAVDRLTKAFAATRWPGDPDNSIPTVLAVRGVRALIIAAAVAWLAAVWQYSPNASGALHALLNTVMVGVFKSVIVLLIADLGWSIAKVLINRRLATTRGDAPVSSDEAARQARLRTLLPIFRNGLAALLLVLTALTVLAEMGVQIGPLIAGAGIFGVAIGFGSQTLVKDVISGVFYLMDDAFRVDEYIVSGKYMGTVESFSLRSVRLRHHRGAVFTVPFGELGAVQNMSRDWAIDKFTLRVNFDTDISKAKKLAKEVGAKLLEDEEIGPLLIQTLKMKGVEEIGDFGIELSFAFTSLPGHQSMIRRNAYSLIRQAFVNNGIGFAQPTVQVGGDEKNHAAALSQTLSAQKKLAEAAAAEEANG
jgi:small-conductance mechanosensitive channel